jgi:hypothetical protein
MKIPKLYFSRKNNATQELEPEKRIPAGQQKNPDINWRKYQLERPAQFNKTMN